MTSRTLNVQIDKHRPIAVLTLVGFMAQLEVYKLKSQLEGLLVDGFRFLVLDLSAITYIDSAGIGVLAHLRAECASRGGQEVIVRPQALQVVKSLETSAIQRVIDFFDDGEAARGFLNQKYGLNQPATSTPASNQNEILQQEIAALENRLRLVEGRLDALEGRHPPE